MRRVLLSAAVGMVVLSTGGGASAGPDRAVFKDGFEKPAVGGAFYRYAAGTQLGAWTVTRGDVDLSSDSLWQVTEGRQNLDLDGGQPGAVAATFATKPLLTYRITYSLGGNYVAGPPVKTGEVRVNGKVLQKMTFDATGKSARTMGFQKRAAYVLAQGSSIRLEFASTTTPGGYGPVVDDVRVDACLLIICPKGRAPAA
jgi:choice-of-anchor C domain-containing protein